MHHNRLQLFGQLPDGLMGENVLYRYVITCIAHQRLLNYIVPDYVHVLAGGKIVKSGGRELALELEDKGYSWIQ